MSLLYNSLFPALWVGYFVYWWTMSRNVKTAERTESIASRLTRGTAIICAIALLWLPSVPLPLFNERFLPRTDMCFWVGSVITAGGLLFSVWARSHLGKNWSQAVTVKEGHELITSGPYALVRHPIYSGLLLAFIGSAVARGEWRGMLAVALVVSVLWRKLRLEEEWMRVQFGESYESYCRRVAALVPYII